MKKASGFITLHRQIMDWEWYRHPHTAFLFIHLLLSANYVDGMFKGMPIKRGQLVTSLTKLSTDTGLSIQQARTALNHLCLTGEVTDDANNQYRVITVVKYDDYQKLTDKLTGNQQATNMRSNRQLTGNSHADQQQYNNNNNITREQINKETNEGYTGDFDFDVFWNEYPRKVDKQAAMKAWKKIKPDEPLMEKIISAVREWKRSDQWTKENGQYIPYPATWLNKRRWEDIPEKKKPVEPSKPVMNSAANFEQRDYSDVPNEILSSLAAEIEQARKDGII